MHLDANRRSPGAAYLGRSACDAEYLLATELAPPACSPSATLDALLPARLVRTDLPTGGCLTLMEQPAERRYIAHLLYAPKATRGSFRGQPIEIIEDLLPLQNVALDLAVPKRIRAVRLVPQDQPLPFTQADGRVRFTVPEFTSHQIVELAR